VSKGIVGALLVGLFAVAFLIAGCGGGDETTSLTRAQFVKQANTICKRQEERRENIIRKAIAGQDQTKLLPLAKREEVVVETVPPYEAMAEELDALGAPEGDEQKVETIVAEMEKAAKSVRSDPKTALETTTQFQEASNLATRYGLAECAI